MINPLSETLTYIQPPEIKRQKVTVVGSCVSRDCFNSKFNPDWRKYFDCNVSAQQNSIISLVSKPYIHELDLENLSEWEKREVIYESKRQFWVDLEIYQPDIIIVDLFSEVRFPVINLGETYITDNSWKIGKANGYNSLSNFSRLSLKDNNEQYLMIFEDALTSFREKILEICPNVKIFLNAPEAAYRYVDGNTISNFDNDQVTNFNLLWHQVNKKFIATFNPTVIASSSSMVIGDSSHPWGKYFVHYAQSFYTHFLNSLLHNLNVRRRDRDIIYDSGAFQISAFYNCKLNSRKWAKGSLNSNGRVVLIDAGVYQFGYLLNAAMLSRANGYVQSGPYHLELVAEHHYNSAIYGGFLVDHYGYFLLESLSRLWSLSILDEPILFQTPAGLNKVSSLPKYMQEIFAILGISERVILVDRPISVETLYIPDAGNILDGFISNKFLQSITNKSSNSPLAKSDLIYLSRSKLDSGVITDESKFENILKESGFKIIHPETLSVKEQIDIISNSKILVGFVGSAFHTMVLCPNLPEKVIYLQRMKDLNVNFNEIDRRLGVNALYIDAVISDHGLKGVGNVDFEKITKKLFQEGIIG
ncbi:glycosyltransferase family 61 protein [Escherichia coli]|nr:glycosyltransferase family 61 protein [Escherichia coli]MHU97101.1 glycosyltransferase family 61 protein [Escherichia coli]